MAAVKVYLPKGTADKLEELKFQLKCEEGQKLVKADEKKRA